MKDREEKYLMINNAHQFCAIIRCDRQSVEDYMEFGKKRVSKADGSIDLQRLSDWLIKRKICHRTLFFKEKNPMRRFLLQNAIKGMEQTARRKNLFLSDEEVDALLCEMAEGNFASSWNSAGIMR